jgi:hypothetical protein
MLVVWVVTRCGLKGGQRRFGGTFCMHLPTSPHIVTTQKLNIDEPYFDAKLE